MRAFPQAILGALLTALALETRSAHSAEAVELLWTKGAPGALDTAAEGKPSLTIFPADAKKAMGTSVVICPGGGYDHLAIDKEGYQVAKWFNTLGVAAFVLKYRVSPYRHPIEMNDAKRAMRYVRANAKRFKIDPDRIGITGFSAGGHLASTVATHFDEGNAAAPDSVDRQGCRPYFQVLVYPVITMEGPYAHGGSRANLLGANPSAEDTRYLSSEKQITAKTPAAFLVHASDDPGVLADNSVIYRDSLAAHGVPAQAKFYSHGPHGFGLANGVAGAPDLPEIATWPGICATWLTDRGYLAQTTSLVPVRRSADPGVWAREGGFDFLGRWRAQPATAPAAPLFPALPAR